MAASHHVRDVFATTHMPKSHEEVKDAYPDRSEALQGDPMAPNGRDNISSRVFLLRLAFLTHAIVNIGQTAVLLWRPHIIMPGFVQETQMTNRVWPLVTVFALQTGAMTVTSLAAVFKFNYEDKVTLNYLMLGYHTLATVNMFVSDWVKSETWIISPAWYHVPTAVMHAIAFLYDLGSKRGWAGPKINAKTA